MKFSFLYSDVISGKTVTYMRWFQTNVSSLLSRYPNTKVYVDYDIEGYYTTTISPHWIDVFKLITYFDECKALDHTTLLH